MLYRVQQKDIRQAGKVLADAFQHDPIWTKVFPGESNSKNKFRAFFEVPVKYGLKYGEVYAPSKNMEGIIAWVPGKYADMTGWRILRSGATLSAMRMGLNTAQKFEPVSKKLTEDRHKHMAGHTYLYLLILGVTTTIQGKGFGKQLIGAAIEKTEREGLPLYLETETEQNVKMYEHFGFSLLEKATLPVVDLPIWEMVRKPQG